MPAVAQPAERTATRADLDALPPNVKGEIIDGVLYTQPRPRPRHSVFASALGGTSIRPFQLGIGGPGGWWISTSRNGSAIPLGQLWLA